MNKVKAIALAVIAFVAVTASAQNSVREIEQNIKYQEKVVEGKQDSIKDLESQIAVLKGRLDSLNKVSKQVKEDISALEKLKKNHENGIKLATKTRKSHYENRDNLVFEQEIADVLDNPYNKRDVEDALKSFEGMETKDVLKKKSLVENYGKYTKELREFLEKQKIILAETGWAMQDSKSDVYKKFMKGLKGVSYWKIYDNSTKNPSIPYLDKVMENLMQQVSAGLNNSHRFEETIDLLYTSEF
ncbi:MAG: hypothetical protein MJZ74_00370 [Muribaculaceae bacterium]|nr:hypothetical protein [Muribaculaceae bacterium]